MILRKVCGTAIWSPRTGLWRAFCKSGAAFVVQRASDLVALCRDIEGHIVQNDQEAPELGPLSTLFPTLRNITANLTL